MKSLTQIALLIAIIAVGSPALAQLPAARLSAVFPPGGTAGTTVEVTLTGIDLDGATELRFSHSGITAKKAGDSATRFTVTIAADVPLGNHDCRVSGRFGISNPRAFVVSDRKEVSDIKPGGSDSAATKLPLDTVVNAKASANAIDFWAIEAKAGQRLMIDCEARSIDSKLSPTIAVVDDSGRELVRSRRTGFAEFTAPADGAFTLRINDSLYRGGAELFYRLSVSTRPHIDAIFPNAGKPGTKSKYTLLGRNLPGGARSPYTTADGKTLEELSVEIELPKVKDVQPTQRLEVAGLVGPSGATLDGFAYRLKGDKGASNAVAILFTESDVMVEAESAQPATARNDKPEDGQRLTLPATVAGRFHPRNDRDCYAFEAKKGDIYYIEVVSDRLSQPTAVSLLLQKHGKDAKTGEEKITDVLESADDETNLGTPAFRTATRDPQMKWEAKEDGLYRLSIRDKFGVSTDDPSRTYLLTIRKPAPDFHVVATPLSAAPTEAALWTPILRKDGVAPIRVALFRKDGHSGDVTVEVDGLPKGVTCNPLTISGTETSGLLVLRAGSDIDNWAGPIKITAKGTIEEKEVGRDAGSGAVVWGTAGDGRNNNANALTEPVVSRLTRDFAVGVCGDESDLISIKPTEDKVYEVMAGTKLSIPLTVKRSSELKAALKLKPVGIDGFRGGRDITVDVKADKATFDLDLNQTKLSPGTYTICLASPAQMKYTRPGEPAASGTDKDKDKGKKAEAAKDASMTVYSAPITFKVLPAPSKKK